MVNILIFNFCNKYGFNKDVFDLKRLLSTYTPNILYFYKKNKFVPMQEIDFILKEWIKIFKLTLYLVSFTIIISGKIGQLIKRENRNIFFPPVILIKNFLKIIFLWKHQKMNKAKINLGKKEKLKY